jgi:uncharacterized protein YabE (DUF348 family)
LHHHRLRRRSSAHVAESVQPSPARAEPHDASAWLPVPVPESLPTVDELLAPEALIVEPDEPAAPTAVPAGPPGTPALPGPGRAEPHDATAWLPLPESEDLPSIHELLNPDEQVEVPAARDITAVPSPARAEPHDATSWLPLPESDDLPELHELLDERGASPAPTPVTRRRHRPHLHRPSGASLRRSLAIVLVAATLGALFYAGKVVLDQGADVQVRVDGRSISAETGVSTVASFLAEQKIDLGRFDRVSPGPSAAIEDGMSVRVLRAFPVIVDFDGEAGKTVYTTHSEPDAFLADARQQLGVSGDLALRDAPKSIEQNASLEVRTKKAGTLLVDGSSVVYDTPAATIGELLATYKVALGPQDYTEPYAVDAVLPTSTPTENISITVRRVATLTESVDELYVLPDESRPDNTMNVGEQREEAGVTGTQRVTYSITNRDGSEVGRTVVSAVPLVEATPHITFYGTKYDGRWDKIAQCETGGNWRAQGPTYQGGLGIFAQTWKGFGGYDFAQNAGDATKFEQVIVAERIRAKHGFRAWGCGKTLGY